MFFTISSKPDYRLPCHEQIGSYFFSHDLGWNNQSNSWHKGYKESDNSGNWATISLDNDTVSLSHGPYRSFPLWWDDDTGILTNLLGSGEPVWADKAVSISNGNLLTRPVNIIGEISLDGLSRDNGIELICDRLMRKACWLQTNFGNFDKKIFVSGGIDTLTVLSLFQKTSVEFELLDYEYLKYDWFLNHNLDDIKKTHWGYGQIHHWTTPTILATGACGDEFMFRGPNIIALWAAWHGIDIMKLISKNCDYHYQYFQKPANKIIFQQAWDDRDRIQEIYQNQEDLLAQIFNINVNDHQHWHLGKTLTWTPFLDLELTKIILRMSPDDVLAQALDAGISKDIITRLAPKNASLLSEQKNHNVRRNLLTLK